MPWELEVNIIDVGQGESSLIIARNTTPPFQHRTMLIDGGFPGKASKVHDLIASRFAALGIASLDHILVSHYDGDHSGGIIALLVADNLYRICDIIAQAAADAALHAAIYAPNGDEDHQIAAGTAAAVAAAKGAYNLGANNFGNVAVAAGQNTWNLNFAQGARYQEVARDGLVRGESAANSAVPNLNESIVRTTGKRRAAAKDAGIAAGLGIAPAPNPMQLPQGSLAARKAAALEAVFIQLRTGVNAASQFQTSGMYHNTHIIDIGNTTHMAGNYLNVLGGKFILWNNLSVQAPGINRPRLPNPNLVSEILWNSGPAPIVAPANSPAIFVVSCRKQVWNGGLINGKQPDNDDSIGLIVRFNQFFYYTGGDLPEQGEDLIATAVMNNGLPIPGGGGNFPTPHRIACFKCGHHGSKHSTSTNFLNTALPRCAFISCGENAFGRGGEDLPTQTVINKLHLNSTIQYFYLTNCRYIRTDVPASANPPQLQLLPPNKSRLSGDNAADNTQAGRQRGDIRLMINQAESAALAGPGRQFRVRYYEADNNALGFRTENTTY